MMPSTAILPRGRCRNGEKVPAREVSFKKVAANIDLVEEHVGNRIVSAFGAPGSLPVSPTLMQGDADMVWHRYKNLI